MYSSKNILYFDPYYFENGENKPKYFLVVKSIDEDLIIASLPTSKDHIPNHMTINSTGCINDDNSSINCFFFKSGDIISECDTFCFPVNTYLYGETIKIVSKSKLESIYQKIDIDYKVLAKLKDSIHNSMIECFKKSGSIKRKIKKYL